MAEAAQARVQDAVTKMINDLDKSILRKMQGNMHICAAKCCTNTEANLEEVHACIEQCARPLTGAQNYVQSEMQHFQDRLQRCVITCQDGIKDRVLPETTEAQPHADEGASGSSSCVPVVRWRTTVTTVPLIVRTFLCGSCVKARHGFTRAVSASTHFGSQRPTAEGLLREGGMSWRTYAYEGGGSSLHNHYAIPCGARGGLDSGETIPD
ncbi:unnamed protein product [Darwinula stevensoni]|uniref:Protein FAM136A n=1 Tax=Darwinula stevensoni TaxID=69355 RepID=A0A7R8X3S4_9CRUS|nr:unnamed protein product [Darwinula stevensoni]CAG0878959.1 unnamed protein product [Darwinula stevensoni]